MVGPNRPGEAHIPDGVSEDDWEIAEITYLGGRNEWVAGHAPALLGHPPPFSAVLTVPGAAPGDDIYFDELDDAGQVCGARRHASRAQGFGTSAEAIGAAAGVAAHDPWVGAVGAALARDRGSFRRTRLEVQQGDGKLAHFSASANRESISRWGLDWTRMGASPGIAGSTEPELPAVFLDSADPHSLFRRMGRTSVDVWGGRREGAVDRERPERLVYSRCADPPGASPTARTRRYAASLTVHGAQGAAKAMAGVA